MKLSAKFHKFMEFSLNRKLPSMMKSRTTEELINLYEEYSPKYFSLDSTMIVEHIKGAIVVFLVGEEMKFRFGDKIPEIQNWDYRNPMNFNSFFIVRKNKENKRNGIR